MCKCWNLKNLRVLTLLSEIFALMRFNQMDQSKCEDPAPKFGYQWGGCTLFVPLDRPSPDEVEHIVEDRNVAKPRGHSAAYVHTICYA